MAKSYFSLLPTELLRLLILDNIYYEDLVVIGQIPEFNKLFGNEQFVEKLWKRDIATEKYTGVLAVFDKYMEILEQFNNYNNTKDKLDFISYYDYDRLLKSHLELVNFDIGNYVGVDQFYSVIDYMMAVGAKNSLYVILSNFPSTIKLLFKLGPKNIRKAINYVNEYEPANTEDESSKRKILNVLREALH